MTDHLLAVHGPHGAELVDPTTPILSAFDLGSTRGDGAFETALVLDGRPLKLPAHLARMGRSAAALGITAPDQSVWMGLVEALVPAWPSAVEGALKLVLTRGVEGAGVPTVYATLTPIDEHILHQRRDGIRVVSLTLGVTADVRAASPWLLGGVKYLSYAVNMSGRRYADSVGADDALWLSVEGELLEGTTSTIIWLKDGVLHTTPPTVGILPGTTQQLIFDRAGEAGFDTAVTRGRIDDLRAADDAWLVSSIRGAARIVALDGVQRPDSGTTEPIQRLTAIPAPR